MKIFLCRKKYILIILVILLLLFLFFIFFFNCFSSFTKTTASSNFSNDFLHNINELTNGKEKYCYLTFDDGPNNLVTPKVLDILKEQNVKATFFVIGKLVDANPEIVKRAYNEGHYIANHSYSHNNNNLYKNFVTEVKNTDLAIGKAIGVSDYSSHVFRFPNGFMASMYKKEKKIAVLELSKLNYTYIDWNCLNNDSMKKYTPAELLNNLKKSSKDKNTLVVLMHDTKDVSNSSLALKDSILFLKSQGYEFKNFYDVL